MKRSVVALLGSALAFLACGHTPSVTTSTTSTDASVTSTTTLRPSTPIGASGILKWTPGDAYVADDFWVPIAFRPVDPGWWSLGSGELWVYLQWHEGGGSLFDIDLAVLAHAPNDAVDVVAASITEDRVVEVTARPAPTTVGGFEGVVFDILLPGELDPFVESQYVGNTRFVSGLESVKLLALPDPAMSDSGTFWFGVRLGRQARVWVLDVAGSTITVIGAVTDPRDFAALAPVVDRLVSAVRFDA